MALHSDFPDSPHAVLETDVRRFPADEVKGLEAFDLPLKMKRTNRPLRN